MNINFRNTHFFTYLIIRSALSQWQWPWYMYTYVRIFVNVWINFGSYVRTAPFATVRKLECGTPTTSFSFVKKNNAPRLLQLVTYTYFVSYIRTLQCVITFTLGFVYRMCYDCCFAFVFLCFAQNYLQHHFLYVRMLLLILVFVHCFC